jgi:ATP-dependent DNA helicase RecQ
MPAVPESSALHVLRARFGFSEFRAGQAEIIHAALSQRDALGVMPTGGGKSLGYTLPALLLDAPVLVVSPLIALMKDQVDGLKRRKIAAEYVNSTVPPDEQRRRVADFRAGRLRLLFVAPERFRSERFLAALAGFRPGLFAVDEAHCISEWGHDFRPDYLRLREAAEALSRPPILALTATATKDVRDHIVAHLGLRDAEIVVRGFERPNLDFEVVRVANKDDKRRRIVEVARAGKRGIVYCATRKHVDEMALELRREKLGATSYHAGMRDDERRAVSEAFASGRVPIVVATNAFGMGIDCPDLRFVVHHDVPGSIEAYTQEAGRAGRDGLPARCVLFFAAADSRLQRFFIETGNPPREVIEQTWSALRATCPVEGPVAEARMPSLVGTAKHAREVDSALRILAERGIVSRGVDVDRVRRVRLLDAPGVDVDWTALRRRTEREYERLQTMTDYATRGGCHRARIVEYFAGRACPSCGNCQGCRATARKRLATPDEVEIVTSLLRMVADINGRYGRRRLVAVVAGKRTKDVVDAGLDRSRHHGTLSHLPPKFLDALMDDCIAEGLLEIEGGEYPLVVLGYRGREALRGREAIHLACFDEHSSRTKVARREE